MKKRIFIKNAAVLTLTAIILRTAGMILRIYLSQTVGAEGMGLYQLIFSVYMLAATFATSGLSTAVTRLCADELVCGGKKSVCRTVRRSIELTVIIGMAVTALIYLFSDEIALYWIRDMRAVPSLKILSFSLCFMGISSCIKGYFMARRKAVLPSTAQFFEQAVRIASVIALIGMFGKNGVEQACFAILCSDAIAEALSCGYLLICYAVDRRHLNVSSGGREGRRITSKLIRISSPIIAGRYLSSILRTIENMAVPECLRRYGGSYSEALGAFGELKGMALPIIFFPSSFLMSMSSLLIPEISQAKALGDDREIRAQVSRAVGITLQSSILISVLFTLLSNQIGVLVYNSENVGFLIRVLSPLIPVMYLESVCDGMLKGLNQQNHSLVYLTIDSLFRIACIFILVPRFGMAGFLGMMVVSNLFTSMMNVIRLMRVSKTRFDAVNWVLKPLLFAALAGITAYCLIHTASFGMIGEAAAVATVVTLIYGGLILITKTCEPLSAALKKLAARKNRRGKQQG